MFCSNVVVKNVTILAPWNSPNTDGIDPGEMLYYYACLKLFFLFYNVISNVGNALVGLLVHAFWIYMTNIIIQNMKKSGAIYIWHIDFPTSRS